MNYYKDFIQDKEVKEEISKKLNKTIDYYKKTIIGGEEFKGRDKLNHIIKVCKSWLKEYDTNEKKLKTAIESNNPKFFYEEQDAQIKNQYIQSYLNKFEITVKKGYALLQSIRAFFDSEIITQYKILVEFDGGGSYNTEERILDMKQILEASFLSINKKVLEEAANSTEIISKMQMMLSKESVKSVNDTQIIQTENNRLYGSMETYYWTKSNRFSPLLKNEEKGGRYLYRGRIYEAFNNFYDELVKRNFNVNTDINNIKDKRKQNGVNRLLDKLYLDNLAFFQHRGEDATGNYELKNVYKYNATLFSISTIYKNINDLTKSLINANNNKEIGEAFKKIFLKDIDVYKKAGAVAYRKAVNKAIDDFVKTLK